MADSIMPGIYPAEIVKHWWETSRSGDPVLAFTLNVHEPEWGTEYPMSHRVYFTPKAAGMARAQLKLLGFDSDAQDLADIGESVSFEGVQVEVTVDEQTYQGKSQVRVARFGGKPKPPEKSALAKATQALRDAKRVNRDAYSDPVEETPPAKPPERKRAEKPPYPDPNAMLTEAEAAAEQAGSDIPF